MLHGRVQLLAIEDNIKALYNRISSLERAIKAHLNYCHTEWKAYNTPEYKLLKGELIEADKELAAQFEILADLHAKLRANGQNS